VNLAVRQGSAFDECGTPAGTARDVVTTTALFWILSDGAEAWLNVPECELFPSAEAALRHRRRR
jgi:hypothetical protein